MRLVLFELYLQDHSYTLNVFGTYAELNVRVRAGECDIGWAPFYVTASREACRRADTCRPLNTTHVDPGTGLLPAYASLDSDWWESRRCCVDFTVVEVCIWGCRVCSPTLPHSSFLPSRFRPPYLILMFSKQRAKYRSKTRPERPFLGSLLAHHPPARPPT